MSNQDFWESIDEIIINGFDSNGLEKLDSYADRFINRKLIFNRFSPQEQYGCATGGSAHVVASLLSRAEDPTNPATQTRGNFKAILQQGERQTALVEKWAKEKGLWLDDIDTLLAENLGEFIAEGGEAKVYDNGIAVLKTIGLDYYILLSDALDRISLHNAYFPETKMEVIGFGRDKMNEFKILISQPFIEGFPMSNPEIESFMEKLGFRLQNPRNWTYLTEDIYLSDIHDENILKTKNGTVFVIDCDIRLNTPELGKGGRRTSGRDVTII